MKLFLKIDKKGRICECFEQIRKVQIFYGY